MSWSYSGELHPIFYVNDGSHCWAEGRFEQGGKEYWGVHLEAVATVWRRGNVALPMVSKAAGRDQNGSWGRKETESE